MPRRKKFVLSPQRQAEIRRDISAWMAQHGHDDVSFARLLGVKPVTVGVNLGRANYKTRRPISDDFLSRVQRVTGLRLVEAPPAALSAPVRLPEPAVVDRLVIFLARAGIAAASQLCMLLHMERGQFNRLAQSLLAARIVEREREPAPPSGLARSRLFMIHRPAGIGCGWVEVETGSGGRRAVQEKADAADLYVRSGGFRRRWSAERLTIFWIGDNDDHARQMLEWNCE